MKMSSISIEQIIPIVSHVLQIVPDGANEMEQGDYKARKMGQLSMSLNIPLEVHNSAITEYFLRNIDMDEFTRRILTHWVTYTPPYHRTIDNLRIALDPLLNITSYAARIITEMTELMPRPVVVDIIHVVNPPPVPVQSHPHDFHNPDTPAATGGIENDDVASGWAVANMNISKNPAAVPSGQPGVDDSDYTISRRGTEEHLKNKSAVWAAAIAEGVSDKWCATNVKNLKGDWSNATWD